MLESVKVRHNATKCTNRSKKLVTFWLPAILGFLGYRTRRPTFLNFTWARNRSALSLKILTDPPPPTLPSDDQ